MSAKYHLCRNKNKTWCGRTIKDAPNLSLALTVAGGFCNRPLNEDYEPLNDFQVCKFCEKRRRFNCDPSCIMWFQAKKFFDGDEAREYNGLTKQGRQRKIPEDITIFV